MRNPQTLSSQIQKDFNQPHHNQDRRGLLLLNVVRKALAEAVRQEDIKWLQTTKEVTLSIYTDAVVIHIKDP